MTQRCSTAAHSATDQLVGHTDYRATYCGVHACGQAVGCGVCDTPELWRGAAGLCVNGTRVVCWCRRIFTCICIVHTYIRLRRLRNRRRRRNISVVARKVPRRKHAQHATAWPLQDIHSLQRFYERAIQHLIPPHTCNAHTVAIVLHDYCARYASPLTLLLYAIHRTIMAMAISCEGQATALGVALRARFRASPLSV